LPEIVTRPRRKRAPTLGTKGVRAYLNARASRFPTMLYVYRHEQFKDEPRRSQGRGCESQPGPPGLRTETFFPELNDPARPAAARPVPWARGGRVRGRSAGQTNRYGESVDQEVHPYPATRRRRTCRGQQRRGLARSVWQAGNALKNREQNRKHGEGDAHANTTRISGGTRMARSARREAAAAKRRGRAENPVCLRGGRWWDP
jgi:hypothetical protein